MDQALGCATVHQAGRAMISVPPGWSRRACAASIALALLVALLAASPSRAALPGVNGKIAYTHCVLGSCSIWTMNADSSNAAPLTPAGVLSQQDPAYSHD